MRSVGIKILKDRLSEYVRLAAQGETVLVTERDRVVAELVPPQSGRSESAADSLLADAVRKGYVSPPLSRGLPLPPARPIGSLAQILADLDADRADR